MIVAQGLNKIYLTIAQSIARFGRFFCVELLRFNTCVVYMLYYFLAGKTFDVVAHNQIYWVNRHRRERLGVLGLQVVFLSRRQDI
jgi:hypothetical protein